MNLQDKIDHVLQNAACALKQSANNQQAGMQWELDQERAAHKATQKLLDQKQAQLSELLNEPLPIHNAIKDALETLTDMVRNLEERAEKAEKEAALLQSVGLPEYRELEYEVLKAVYRLTPQAMSALQYGPHHGLMTLHQAIVPYLRYLSRKAKGK